jgi:hypothetical protein
LGEVIQLQALRPQLETTPAKLWQREGHIVGFFRQDSQPPEAFTALPQLLITMWALFSGNPQLCPASPNTLRYSLNSRKHPPRE